jgi:hypothetical protein
MLREEEDDLTQEMRQLVMLKTQEQLLKYSVKIEEAKIPEKDEWSIGLNQGLEWAARILRGDKSAS